MPTTIPTDKTLSALQETFHGVPLEDLTKEDRIKFEKHPLDIWERMEANARDQKFPEGGDVFRYKYHGLFYDPASATYMLRCRIAGGILTADQFEGLSGLSAELGDGHAAITTRANFQMRGFQARHGLDLITRLDELGLSSKGSGADNIRNITCAPTCGIDTQEMIDVRPYVRALHHRILNDRSLFDLPRKFNIAFDSGGSVSALADTNDIGFYPIKVETHTTTPTGDIPSGFYFRVLVGGLTGRKSFGSDLGLWIPPIHVVDAAVAICQVFQESGCRTNRRRARLKDLIEEWGLEKFAKEVRRRMPVAIPYEPFPWFHCEARTDTRAHIGIHPQKQVGLYYAGIAIPAGRMTALDMRELARLARDFGSGEIRLTVWQNILIPNIPFRRVALFQKKLSALGFSTDAAAFAGGVVACTGNQGCRLSASDTKGHALRLIEHLEKKLKLKRPVNIHLSGCAHSCAQHYIGDIGLIATKLAGSGEEGYHLYLGGGAESRQKIGREILRGISGEELPLLIERILVAYREKTAETQDFSDFVNDLGVEELQNLFLGNGSLTV